SVTGLRGGFCRTFDDEFGNRLRESQIGRTTDIAVLEFDTGRLQPRQVEFGTAPMKVVESGNFQAGMTGLQMDGKARAYKTSSACDQNLFIHSKRWRNGAKPVPSS